WDDENMGDICTNKKSHFKRLEQLDSV
ncbi:MAG: hypothetical protein ACJAQX_002041, partial [Polaribacter sp.]